MIHDGIEHLERYGLSFIHAIEEFLSQNKVEDLPLGETEILKNNLFVIASEYPTRPANDLKFETHKVFIDLQYVLSGQEIMETAPSAKLTPCMAYDAVKDCRFFLAERDISRTLVREGEFIVFFPGEAHKPTCSPAEGVNTVRKLVFKARWSFFQEKS